LDEEVELIFKRALELLKVAEFTLNNDFFPDSINRSYYAVFYAAKALLVKKGVITKTHSGTIHKFGLEYVINGKFDKEIGKFFSKLGEDRDKADYDYSHNITEEKARTDFKNAKKFVEECRKFL